METHSKPSRLSCTELFRIKSLPHSFSQGIASFFTSTPGLSYQITQATISNEEHKYPAYNIWSPAYFGISLPDRNTGAYKLNRNDFLVTRYEDDTASLKDRDMESLCFDIANIIGTVDVDPAPFFCCTCCFRYRGSVRLANGERWIFDEIDHEYFRFSRDKSDLSKDSDLVRSPLAISWYPNVGGIWRNGETKPDLPFEMDKNMRICRLNLGNASTDENDGRTSPSEESWYSLLSNPTVAIMHSDGVAFLGNSRQGVLLGAGDLRDLVVLTGLAVARLERPRLTK